jgi:hypothetical protein
MRRHSAGAFAFPQEHFMEWQLVYGNLQGMPPIGAVGFIDNTVVAIVAFYDGRDANKDGKVSKVEWVVHKMSPVNYKNANVAEVAVQASREVDIISRDAGFRQMAADNLTGFAVGLLKDGVYASYFKAGVSMVGGGIAKQITESAVKGFAIKKGFETVVKAAFNAAVNR